MGWIAATRALVLTTCLGAAVCATVGESGASASAARTWTVSAGSASPGTTVRFSGATQGAVPQVILQDLTTGTTFGCNSGRLGGNLVVGSGQSGTRLAALPESMISFSPCPGPLGWTLNLMPRGTWSLNGTIYAGTNMVTGPLAGVRVDVSSNTGCSFTASGSLAATYRNSTQLLKIEGNSAKSLRISQIDGCFGAFDNRDRLGIQATYKITTGVPRLDPITITSP